MTRTATRPQLNGEDPWPGLESFREDERAFFFGRERESAALLQHVLDAAVTVLYGRSGLGKTSLLRAGLFPLLREQRLMPEQRFLPVYVRFEVKPGAPPLARQLHQSVHNSIRAELPGAVLPSDEESLWEYLHRRDIQLWNAENDRLTPVIVLDQFEELFTLGERAPDLVEAFRNDLGDLAENRIPADLSSRIESDEAVAARFDLRSRNFKLLISLREDYLPDLEEWCRLIPALGRSRMRLLPLNRDDAFDAVHEPAKDLMTAALAKRVVDIVAGENLHRDSETAVAGVEHRGNGQRASYLEPALLSLFCRELNEERKRLGQERFEEQLVESAESGILSNYYSACVRDLPHVAEFVEDELITEKGFRNSYAREDAVPSILTDDELGRLIDSRLLRVVEYHGAQRIELTHDVLTRVVREHRDRRRAEQEKAALAARAERERQALAQAAAQREAELDRERRVGRRLRLISAVLAIVCVAALSLMVVTVVYWHSAKVARNEALAERNEALADRLTFSGLKILSGGQPGSEPEAIDKLLAAQHLSTSPDIVGAALTALSREARLQKAFDLPPEGTFSTDTRTAPVYGQLTAEGEHVITRTKAGFQILHTQTGELIGPPFGNPDDIIEGVSPDGRYLAMVGKDYSIHVVDSGSRQPFGLPLAGNDSVFRAGVAVSSDGRHVAAADSVNTVRLWDAQTGRQIASLAGRHDAKVTALAFSPDGRSLASAGHEYTVRLWDSENGAALRETTRAGNEDLGPNDAIVSLAFSPDGHTIAGGGRSVGIKNADQGRYFNAGSALRLWNADTGEAIGKPLADNFGTIQSIAFSSTGDRVVTAGTDKMIRLWDAHTGQPVGDPVGLLSPVDGVAFTRQGNRIVGVSGDTVQTLDVDSDAGLPVEAPGSRVAHLADTHAAWVMTTDPPRIAVVNEGSLRWLDPDTGEQVGPTVVSDALPEIGKLLDISTNMQWLAVAEPDNTVRILDASNGQPSGGLLKGHSDKINDASFSPDGKVIATASNDTTVRLWDWRKGSLIGEVKGHKYGVQSVNFSQDGRRLVSRSSDSIRTWDTTSGRAIGKPIGGPGSAYIYFTSAKLSSDGRRIAAATPFTIQQWDADTGEPVGPPMLGNNNKQINDIAYSPDGRYLVSISQDKTLRFWDSTSDQQIGEPVDITAMGAALYVGFSHDARRVFIAAAPMSLSGSPPLGGGIWQIPAPTVWADGLCDKLVLNPSEQQWKDWISPDVPYQEPCRGKRRSQ
ncbi:MAG TPA: hypothetical protein VME67_26720 [Mycobacterium sp.]|nr:hypothetical protein [Mycobacterium sp.]HTX98109.1 hypothetical protein [Mycobacterium sp.]